MMIAITPEYIRNSYFTSIPILTRLLRSYRIPYKHLWGDDGGEAKLKELLQEIQTGTISVIEFPHQVPWLLKGQATVKLLCECDGHNWLALDRATKKPIVVPVAPNVPITRVVSNALVAQIGHTVTNDVNISELPPKTEPHDEDDRQTYPGFILTTRTFAVEARLASSHFKRSGLHRVTDHAEPTIIWLEHEPSQGTEIRHLPQPRSYPIATARAELGVHV